MTNLVHLTFSMLSLPNPQDYLAEPSCKSPNLCCMCGCAQMTIILKMLAHSTSPTVTVLCWLQQRHTWSLCSACSWDFQGHTWGSSGEGAIFRSHVVSQGGLGFRVIPVIRQPPLAFTCHGCLAKILHMTLRLPVVTRQSYKHLQYLFHSHRVFRIVTSSPNPLKQLRNNGSEIYITLCCLKITDCNCVGVTEFLMLELAVKKEYICSSILFFSLHILMPEFWFRKDLKRNWPRNFSSLPISVDPCAMCFQGDSMNSR